MILKMGSKENQLIWHRTRVRVVGLDFKSHFLLGWDSLSFSSTPHEHSSSRAPPPDWALRPAQSPAEPTWLLPHQHDATMQPKLPQILTTTLRTGKLASPRLRAHLRARGCHWATTPRFRPNIPPFQHNIPQIDEGRRSRTSLALPGMSPHSTVLAATNTTGEQWVRVNRSNPPRRH